MDSLWTEFVKSGAVSDYLRYRAHCGIDNADSIGINCGQTAQTGKKDRPDKLRLGSIPAEDLVQRGSAEWSLR